MMKNMSRKAGSTFGGNIKKYFLFLIIVEIFFAYTPALAQTAPYDYRGAGISDQIRQYLCAPSPVDSSQTINYGSGSGNNFQTANLQNQAAFNNKSSGDLYRCINQIYKFSIIIASVVGVFFIVIAGYVYMSAEGNDESVTKAKDILVSTISSLVILFAGYILLKAINPDLIRFNSIQPPSVVLTGASIPGTGGPTSYNLAGYNIGRYATGKDHERVVTQIYNSLGGRDLSTAQKITDYMKLRSSNNRVTPLTGEMILSSAQKYNVDFKLMLAIMEVDSHFGTDGSRAINNNNPGNVGNVDSGQNRYFPSWQAGVDAVAEWLSRHRA